MKVTEHIQAAKDTLFSFEILPPLKGKSIQSIYDGIDPLMEFKPKFINNFLVVQQKNQKSLKTLTFLLLFLKK